MVYARHRAVSQHQERLRRQRRPRRRDGRLPHGHDGDAAGVVGRRSRRLARTAHVLRRAGDVRRLLARAVRTRLRHGRGRERADPALPPRRRERRDHEPHPPPRRETPLGRLEPRRRADRLHLQPARRGDLRRVRPGPHGDRRGRRPGPRRRRLAQPRRLVARRLPPARRRVLLQFRPGPVRPGSGQRGSDPPHPSRRRRAVRLAPGWPACT